MEVADVYENCDIRIARANGHRKEGRDALALYIGERRLEAPPAQIALLTCLHEHQGRIVPYEYLGQLLGYKTVGLQQLHVLRQHMFALKRALAAHEAPYVLAVAHHVGYALCGHIDQALPADLIVASQAVG
jgi:DNA-binding response OmpR family regulator